MSDKVREVLHKFVMDKQSMQVITCKVISVNESEATATCKPINDGPEYFNVRLRAVVDSGATGIIPIPEVGSFVLIGLIGNSENDAFVILIEKIAKYHLNAALITFNGDANGGLLIADKVFEAIHRLETLFNAHVHTGNGVTTTTLATPATIKDNLINQNIKHG
jgi:hypothetical protein